MFSFAHKTILGVVTWVSSLTGLAVTKYVNTPKDPIILGIYEDYMDPKLSIHAGNKYQIYSDYFIHDQVVQDRFKKGIYDVAVVSTSILEELINSKLARPIDWKDLNLNKWQSTKERKDNKAQELIEKGEDSISLYTSVVRAILNSKKKLINYGIPYFMNKLSFCYRGTPIEGLHQDPVTWKKLFEVITKEKRFRSKRGKSQLGLIEDQRTILSLARFVAGEKNVNPTFEKTHKNHQFISHTYNSLISSGFNSKQMGRNFLFLSPNSSALVDSLVDGDIQGSIMYNADCLYASYGGNVSDENPPKDLNLVKISNNIFFLDFLVISEKLSEKKRKKVYEFYKEVVMNGHNVGKKILDKEDDAGDDDQEYKYKAARNFDYVRYTPVLRNLNRKVQEEYFCDDETLDGEEYSAHKDKIIKLRKEAAEISWQSQPRFYKNIKNLYETAFSPKTKSDMLIAFEKFKIHL